MTLRQRLMFLMTLLYLLLLGVVLVWPFSAKAAENSYKTDSFWSWPAITDGWWGQRQRLVNHGLNFEFVYTADVMGVVKGGVTQEPEYLDNIDLTLTVDLERLVHWKGATIFLYGLGNHGGSPSAHTGDAQGVSNMDSPDYWRFHEAWFQQILLEDRFSLLLGIYDINSEFDSMQTSALFLNGSHGMGVDYSQAGPSIFPNTGLAGRIRVAPVESLYVQVVVADAVPGNPNDPEALDYTLRASEGALMAGEIGYLPAEGNADAPYGKFAFGGWGLTSKSDDLLDVDGLGNPERHNNWGLYLLGESNVYRESDAAQGLSLYGRVGTANGAVNQFRYYVGGGAVYTGLIPARDQDSLGLAVAAAINGGKYKSAVIAGAGSAETVEVNFELTYKLQLTPWLAVQPDVQYVINPGTDPAVADALVLGSRIELML